MPDTRPIRRILSCDGGGIRGIITLRCLEAFEEKYGPCRDYFDMFAGTSTGAIIAGSLANGVSVKDLLQIYTERRAEIFSRRFLGFLHPLATKYGKSGLRAILREYFADLRLAELDRDVLITAVDTVRSETIYFSSFQLPGGGAARYGSYQNVRLRDAVEASASAPTYFPAHGRFIDGGTTIYNNPAYTAAVEALRYSSDLSNGQSSRYSNCRLDVYSFATGSQAQAMRPDEAERKSGLGWLRYVIGESGNQAGIHHSYVAQNELDLGARAIHFYRYDLHLTPEILQAAAPGTAVEASSLALDAIDDESFEVMSQLGSHYGAYLRDNGFFDPVPPAVVVLPPAPDPARAREAARRWVRFGQPRFTDDYVQQVLRQFDEISGDVDA